MAVSLDDIINFFEKDFADINKQSIWDFSGKQIYLGDCEVKKATIALDPTLDVIMNAIDRGCELLITHHPLFFNPFKGLSVDKVQDLKVIAAIRGGLSILSYHTTLDMADFSTNSYLIEMLGAKEHGFLSYEGEILFNKIVVFAPIKYADKIIDAMSSVGAGKIGNYQRCAFTSEGKGTFTPVKGAKPFLGKVNNQETVEEVRIEMIVPASVTPKVIDVMRVSHPYEEPAYDIFPLKGVSPYGHGRIAQLDQMITLTNMIACIKERTGLQHVRCNMSGNNFSFKKFAVLTGSGASSWKDCLKKGIPMLITGDVKHHDALDAREAGVCIIDIGHYFSEFIYMKYISELIFKKFDIVTFVDDISDPLLFQ